MLQSRRYRQQSNVEQLSFGDLRGKNSLEYCDVLFVIGTYCINKEDLEQDFSNWYARDPSTMEFIEQKPHGDFYHYQDKNVETLRWMWENYEMYQAIHRIRPLRGKKQVYVFGVVPEEIGQDGLKVIEIEGGYEKTMDREEIAYRVLSARAAFGINRCAINQINAEETELENDVERWKKLHKTATNYLVIALRLRTELLDSTEKRTRDFIRWYLKNDYTGWIHDI